MSQSLAYFIHLIWAFIDLNWAFGFYGALAMILVLRAHTALRWRDFDRALEFTELGLAHVAICVAHLGLPH